MTVGNEDETEIADTTDGQRDQVGGLGIDHGHEPKRCGNGTPHHAKGQDAYCNRTKGEGDKSGTASTEGVEDRPRTEIARAH